MTEAAERAEEREPESAPPRPSLPRPVRLPGRLLVPAFGLTVLLLIAPAATAASAVPAWPAWSLVA
ncbi:hypothetical protein, partial [Microbispora rosea]